MTAPNTAEMPGTTPLTQPRRRSGTAQQQQTGLSGYNQWGDMASVRGAPAGGAAMPSTQGFTADSNLIGTQINPTNSAVTNGAQRDTTRAGQQYNNFQLGQFQGMQPLNFGTERGMLGGANTAMQGLKYDFSGANSQYGNAQSQLGAAANTATGALTGLQGLGTQSFSGGGANTADFGAANNTISQATNAVGQPFAYQGDVGQTRGMTSDALKAAMTGPERSQLAAENMSLLEARSQPGYEQSLRQVGEKNAAMGRRGSGITTNELGDVTLARERELALARRDSANQAAGQTLQDRIDRTNLGLNVSNGFAGQDVNAAQTRLGQANTLLSASGQQADQGRFNASQQESASQRAAQGSQFGASFQRGVSGDLYGMGRDQSNLSMDLGDRSGQQTRDITGLGERQAGFQRGIANDLGGMTRDTYNAGVNERDSARADEYNQGDFLGNRFDRNSRYLNQNQGQDRSNRNELRGERDYQYGLSQDAVQNDFQRQGFEESLRNGRYNRAQGTAALGFNAPSPYGAYQDAAGQANGNAQDYMSAIGGFAQQYGARNRRSGSGSGGTQYAGTPVYG